MHIETLNRIIFFYDGLWTLKASFWSVEGCFFTRYGRKVNFSRLFILWVQKSACLFERFNPTNHGFLMHYTQFGNSWKMKKIILFGIHLMIINLAIYEAIQSSANVSLNIWNMVYNVLIILLNHKDKIYLIY